MEGKLNGVTAWGSLAITEQWRLTAGLARVWQRLRLEPGSASIGGTAAAGNDPRYWWQLGSSFNIAPGHELDLRVRRVGMLPSGPVPSYTAVDLRYGWRVRPKVELSLTVQNLFDPGHPEWGGTASRAEIERAAFFKVLWRI
jgi:iron complex outermembrane receptor protein